MGVVAIAMAVMLFNSLHELAHGAALVAYGGRVRRFGVMVMYGAPALFCDVTDAWRLPSRQRCAVALAGVLASLGLAGTAATAYALVPGLRVPAVGTIAVLTYCSAVLNIVPFVKFDGYLALMARVDIPHLRAKAMHDWRDLVVSTLVGAPRHPQLPSLRWAPAFGFACCVTPVLLVGLAVTGLLHAAALLGVPGLVVLPVVAGAPLALVASRLPTWSATVRAVRSRDLGPASERRT
jgi:putative peptide zinc metalloprotease protein